jgi:hypothetical protein
MTHMHAWRPARARNGATCTMLVLGTIMHHAIADAEDIATWLGVPVVAVLTVCADLEAVGLVTPSSGH